ncbi:hypothetical protein BCR32DRAFT_288778 [Anaeromyces robustus]|uniref:PIN domain-containing protein n=1 Tax=Anaeromyces robustus TaxID=1754192 RepID=A0A1Y1XR81_9FUNG|nr:hypothetical protein BCR32DRAFT_288778 [Anaeromyces robustus]|eukprot:ORX88271.1 hypothetical protein BCR32DRAFT_288778 [Anaeromyces robustus]
MDTKIWKLGIYKLFNLFRTYLINLYNYKDKNPELYENVKQKSSYFINESLESICYLIGILKSYDPNSNTPLHGNVKFNRYQIAWHRCVFYINDLYRYQFIHELISSEQLDELWEKANFINKYAIFIAPNNGLLYHQMAILQLSKRNTFKALYYFLRSLTVRSPYNSARETHITFFDNISKEFNEVCNEYSSVYTFETLPIQYIHLHGILYSKIGTENFEPILKRLMKAIIQQSNKLTPLLIRTTAICNIAIFQHYLNIKNDDLLYLPIQLHTEQLETYIRIYLENQDSKFLHYIEIILYWFIISLSENATYMDIMKPKLKIIWPLLVKVSNTIEQKLISQNININVEDSSSDEIIENEEDNENREKSNDLSSLKFFIVKNADSDEPEYKQFLFSKPYDLELRGFSPLQKIYDFIEYDYSVMSNYEQWYNEIMNKCNNMNNDEYNECDDNNLNLKEISNISGEYIDDSVEEERIIILMNIIKKYVNEIEFDEETYYWNYRYEQKMNNYTSKDDIKLYDFTHIDFNEISDDEDSPSDQIDIFNSLDKDIYNNSDVDELRKKKQLLSDYITDPNESNRQEVIINPQLTKIIFDTNCYINSLNSIKNIFENTNLNIIIPLAVITELSGLQNCKKSAKNALDYLKYITSQTSHRASIKIVTTKGNTLYNIDNIYHENWDNLNKDFMNADDVILSCFSSNSNSYNQNNNLSYTKNILVSNDKNMRLKARVQNITAYNNYEFIRILKRKSILS